MFDPLKRQAVQAAAALMAAAGPWDAEPEAEPAGTRPWSLRPFEEGTGDGKQLSVSFEGCERLGR